MPQCRSANTGTLQNPNPSFYVRLVLLALAFAALGIHAARADDAEQKIGAAVYSDLLKKGQIIKSSPLYTPLESVALPIARVANPQYDAPFHFVLVHQSQPNAFSVPGGNVYVTDSLLHFVRTREELGGVLCHETAHTIHHDVTTLMRKSQQLQIGSAALSLLLGGRGAQVIDLAAGLQANSFSRDVERAADLTGASICARAHINPWGMIWLLQHFEKADTGGQMEMLSDHPTNEHRIADLESLFAEHPEIYGSFSRSATSGTPLHIP
jgi:beta-barrel assembly-enhancing protease